MRLRHFGAVYEGRNVVTFASHLHVPPALRVEVLRIGARHIVNSAIAVRVGLALLELDFEAVEGGAGDHGVARIANQYAAIEDRGARLELQVENEVAIVLVRNQPAAAAIVGQTTDND